MVPATLAASLWIATIATPPNAMPKVVYASGERANARSTVAATSETTIADQNPIRKLTMAQNAASAQSQMSAED